MTLLHPSRDTADSPETDDAALLRAFARTKDDVFFGRLVGRHAEAIRTIAYRNTGNATAAEDVTQATFIVLSGRLRQAGRSAQRKGSLRPWLAKVCRYCCANWRRAEVRRKKREQAAAVPERVDPSQPGELTEAVASAMRSLRSRERRVIELRHFDDKPWPEVAAAMKTTPDAAKKAGQRALERLRGVLERRGVTASAFAVVASLGALRRVGKAAPPATPLTFELARGVLMMMKIKGITTAVITLTAIGLVGFGVGDALSQSGEGESGEKAVASAGSAVQSTQPAPATAAADDSAAGVTTTLRARSVTFSPEGKARSITLAPAEGDSAMGDEASGEGAGEIGGLSPEMFGRIHGAPPQVRLESELNFDEVPLVEVIEAIQEMTGLPIDFHAGALALEGVEPDTPVTFYTPAGTDLGQVMRRMLPLVGGGFGQPRFAWRHEAYMVTTADGLEAMDQTVESQLGELLLEMGEGEQTP